MSDQLLLEIQQFEAWAVPQGLILDGGPVGTANANILAEWLKSKNYPMVFDSLVSAFAQCKAQLQFKPTEVKPVKPVYEKAWSRHTDGVNEAARLRQEGLAEEARVRSEMLAALQKSEKIAKGEIVEEPPKLIPIPEDADPKTFGRYSAEQIRDWNKRQASRISLEDKMNWLRTRGQR